MLISLPAIDFALPASTVSPSIYEWANKQVEEARLGQQKKKSQEDKPRVEPEKAAVTAPQLGPDGKPIKVVPTLQERYAAQYRAQKAVRQPPTRTATFAEDKPTAGVTAATTTAVTAAPVPGATKNVMADHDPLVKAAKRGDADEIQRLLTALDSDEARQEYVSTLPEVTLWLICIGSCRSTARTRTAAHRTSLRSVDV